MSTIVTRAGKGSPLTNTEVDNNFTNLNTDKVEKSGSTMTGDLAFGDNVKAKFGASNDLEIYHDGSNSYIHESGTGSLFIQAYAGLVVRNPIATEKILEGYVGGAVSLYYDNSKKLATTSSGVDITGNITVSGTVDGRDVATDGSKLDGIEAGATADQTKADIDALAINADQVDGLEASQFLRSDANDTATGNITVNGAIKTNTADSSSDGLIIENTGGALVNAYFAGSGATDNFVLTRSGTGGSEFEITSAGVVNLGHNGNGIKLATTSTGVDITGTVVADGLTISGSPAGNDWIKLENTSAATSTSYHIKAGITGVSNDSFSIYDAYNAFSPLVILSTGAIDFNNLNGTPVIRIDTNGDVQFREDTGTTAKLTWDASAEELQFKDNVKAEFGDGGDLQIYHDGSNSYINESGTGSLILKGGGTITLKSPADENLIQAVGNGSVFLYYDNAVKLSTQSSGVDVTGTVTADGLTLGVADKVVFGSDISGIYRNTSGNDLSLLHWGNVGILIDSDNNDSVRQFVVGRNSTDASTADIMLKVAESGDISFYDDAGTSQDFYWDASTSRLGINTIFPSALLDIYNTNSSSPAARFYGNFQTIQNLRGFQIYNNQSGGQVDTTLVYGNTANSYLAFGHHDGTSYAERMRIDSNGRLGIGTTSPSSDIHIAKSSSVIRMEDTDNNSYGMIVYNTASGGLLLRSDHNQLTGTSGSNIIFQTDGSEVARFDSNGRLGIGTTSPASPLQVNRASTDGDIVTLSKDGTTIGSIGVDNTDNIFLSGNSTHSGLMVGTESIVPYSNGATTDATEDLGVSSIRWRNLYLSGGVYLGGTGSANLLDDYEEGTWTPSFNGYSTGFTGKYTKIGNIIHCRIERTTSIPSSSITGSVTITGLPFVAQRSYTPLLGHIRAASSTRPFGIVRNSSIGLVTDSVFGSLSYYNETHANWDGSNLTQNGTTAVYIAWEFKYRQG